MTKSWLIYHRPSPTHHLLNPPNCQTSDPAIHNAPSLHFHLSCFPPFQIPTPFCHRLSISNPFSSFYSRKPIFSRHLFNFNLCRASVWFEFGGLPRIFSFFSPIYAAQRRNPKPTTAFAASHRTFGTSLLASIRKLAEFVLRMPKVWSPAFIHILMLAFVFDFVNFNMYDFFLAEYETKQMNVYHHQDFIVFSSILCHLASVLVHSCRSSM